MVMRSELYERAFAAQNCLVGKLNEIQTENKKLRSALAGMVDMYVEIVCSGDAGFWDAEEVKEVIAAREALKEHKP